MKRDTSEGLEDPFNRWNGRFRNNIRSETGDLGELKESMCAPTAGANTPRRSRTRTT